jgi:hypothetical protein
MKSIRLHCERRKLTVMQSLTQILRVACPTLINLTMLAHHLVLPTICHSFARLTDLTLHYDVLMRRTRPSASTYLASDSGLILGTIRQLHLIKDSYEGFVHVFRIVHSLFPSLVNIRLSGIGILEMTPAVLRTHLGIPADIVNEDASLTSGEKQWLRGKTDDRGQIELDLEVNALRGIMKRLHRLCLQRCSDSAIRNWELRGKISVVLRWLVNHDDEGKLVLVSPQETVDPLHWAKRLWETGDPYESGCWTAE